MISASTMATRGGSRDHGVANIWGTYSSPSSAAKARSGLQATKSMTMESVHKIFLFTFLISTFLSLIQRLPKGSQRTSPQNKNAMNKRCVHSFMACQIQVRYTVSPPHDSIYSSSIDTMIALHSCDSPQDLLRTAQGTRSGQPVPFGSVPFPCAAVLPGLWPRGTDKHRASIQSYLSIYTFLSSLGRKVNRYLFINILLLLSHSLFPLKIE